MNMAMNDDAKDFRRQLLFSLGGIMVGLAVAGLIALLINNVIEPTMQVETQDLVQFPGETFLSDLLVDLDVSLDDIPLPIDVLVHDSPEMMQQMTSRRKSSKAMYSFYSVIDLLQSEDPTPRLSELVLAFGWGRCSSQLLYKGMLMNVLSPGRDFNVPLAAAPTRLLYSLEDLFMLEDVGAFEETIYQRYQSPFSPRMAFGSLEGLAEFRSMLTTIGDEAADYSIAELQAASLVQYLIDCSGGLEAFRGIWGPGTSEALIARLTCGPLIELSSEWLSTIQTVVPSAAGYEYYRARFLFEAGDVSAAARVTDAWNPQDLSSSDSILAVRTQLAVGNSEAAAYFAITDDSATSATLVEWVAVYEGWGEVSNDRLTVFGNGTNASLEQRFVEVQEAYDLAATAFGFGESELPEHVTVFYYDSDEVRDAGESIIPTASVHKTIWHISSQDNIVEEFVVTLPSFVTKKSTASRLLRRGLSAIVLIDRNELILRGCEKLQTGEWEPLWRLGFGGIPDQLFETQTGLMIQYIVDTYGIGVVRDLWVATARIGGGVSLDTAIKSVLGTSRTEIEKILVDSVLNCE